MPKYPQLTLNKIKYDSPSGFVNIGKYIPPFEKVKKGYGYVGVVVEDCESGHLQCHICGGWFGVFNSHLKKHKINSNEYKKMFGLSRSTALKSKKVRLRQSEIMIELRKGKKYQNCFKKNNLFAGNRKGKPKSIETVNKYGVCDLQIMDRVMKLRDRLGKTPTLVDLKNEYGASFVFHLYKRYSSYITLCKENGLVPVFSSNNPKYSKEYFIQKGLSAEPSIRILTTNEEKALYRHFKSVKSWKKACNQEKMKEQII